MIRRGKAEGWLTIPSDAVLPWAMLNDVEFNKSVPGIVSGRGGALLAKEDVQVSEGQAELTVLLTVPKDLVLSLERCQEQAKFDRDYREVLESLGDFGRVGIGLRIPFCKPPLLLIASQTPRGAILSFLLIQASMACPQLSIPVSVHTAFSE
jgi:hypothetical protein